MAALLAIAGFRMKAEDDLLAGASLAEDGSGNRGARNIWRTNLNLLAVCNKKNLIENHCLSGIAYKLFDFNLISGGNFVLLASGFYNSKDSHLIDCNNSNKPYKNQGRKEQGDSSQKLTPKLMPFFEEEREPAIYDNHKEC